MHLPSTTIAAILIRRPAVQARTGLPTATLYLMMKKGQFPRPVKLGARAVAWHSDAVDSWIASRLPAGPAALALKVAQ